MGDSMADKIYELYQENKNRVLDDKFINSTFETMLEKESGILPYIKNFIITDEDKKRFGMKLIGYYSLEDKSITINKKTIKEQSINHQLYTLHVLKHELEHVKNLKKLYEGKNDIETLIINCSLRSYAIEHGIDRLSNIDEFNKTFLNLNTWANYEIDPGERLVDIRASKYLVNLLKNQRDSEDLLIARSMLYYAYIRGYKDNRYYLDAPTLEFLRKTGMYVDANRLKTRIDENDYSFDTRITYGLPITYPEYNDKVLKKVKLQKKFITGGEKDE